MSKTRRSTLISLQQRDIEILKSVGSARLLTTVQIDWLHGTNGQTDHRTDRDKNGWRDRYRAHINNSGSIYRASRRIDLRVHGLEQRGFLVRIRRSVSYASTDFKRLADCIGLTTEGLEIIEDYVTRTEQPFNRSSYTTVDPRTRTIQNIEHTLAIGQFYAALRAELEYRKQTLEQWQCDIQLSRSYDRVTIPTYRDDIGIIPDGTFVLNGTRYFLETDRGTRPMDSWTKKIRAYETYRNNPKLKERYKVNDFVLVITAPTRTRANRIAQEIASVVRIPNDRYLLTIHTDNPETNLLHPLTIRRGWLKITDVKFSNRRIADKMVETATVQLGNYNLWENPSS